MINDCHGVWCIIFCLQQNRGKMVPLFSCSIPQQVMPLTHLSQVTRHGCCNMQCASVAEDPCLSPTYWEGCISVSSLCLSHHIQNLQRYGHMCSQRFVHNVRNPVPPCALIFPLIVTPPRAPPLRHFLFPLLPSSFSPLLVMPSAPLYTGVPDNTHHGDL